MLPVHLIAVGNLKTPWLRDGRDEYVKRLQAFCTLHITEVPASKQADSAKQLREECAQLEKLLAKHKGDVWLLDDSGKQHSSPELAALLQKQTDTGTPLTLVIGGAYGLSDDVKTLVSKHLSLGKMTLPHELCQVVLLEQLYRGFSILAGKGYHH